MHMYIATTHVMFANLNMEKSSLASCNEKLKFAYSIIPLSCHSVFHVFWSPLNLIVANYKNEMVSVLEFQ